jgi:uncharacterized protein YqeY
MSLEDDLTKQLTAALKAKDQKTANLVRMIKTKIMERRTAEGFSGVVDDALVLDVISTYKKAMEKAKKQFDDLGDKGAEQAAELGFEVEWCAKFLPQGLGEAELRQAVSDAIAEGKITDPKQAGRVVGLVKKKHGDRADAALVKKIAEELLTPAS